MTGSSTSAPRSLPQPALRRRYFPCRSLLSVPAIKARALEKAAGLAADGLILDLEDSVAREAKSEARDLLASHCPALSQSGKRLIIRINGRDDSHHAADLDLVARLRPDALLIPKVSRAADVVEVAEALAARGAGSLCLMAMIETAEGLLKAGEIAETLARQPTASRPALVIGLNDLRKETRTSIETPRSLFSPWLMQVVLAARAFDLDPVDSVFNDFRAEAAFARECAEGKAMGFSGKMLIHPDQIAPANRLYGASESEIARARRIIAAFGTAEASGQGVIALDGEMIERLHLDEARRLLEEAGLKD